MNRLAMFAASALIIIGIGGADDVDARGGCEADLDRDGVVALHLLGALSRGLCRDFQDDGSGVGIGLDIELGEGDEAGADENDQAQENNGPPRQSEEEEPADHGLGMPMMIASAEVRSQSGAGRFLVMRITSAGIHNS